MKEREMWRQGLGGRGKKKPWKGVFGKTCAALVELLYPSHCPVCDRVLPFGKQICPACRGHLQPIREPWCMKCGKKLSGEGEYCGDCTRREHAFVRGRAMYEYSSVAASIYRFKYRGRREYTAFFGQEIVAGLGDFIREIAPDGLLPVPLHPARMAARGYNQAELLARDIGRRLGIPVYGKLVRRVRNTRPLKQLNPKERQNNLKRAFNMPANDVKLKKIIVIDDIYTTGSTMDAVAEVLLAGGVQDVYFITLACGAGV